MSTYIIYHQHCTDGFCSAWLLSKAIKYDQMIACDPSTPFPVNDINENDYFYIADISFSPQVLTEVANKCKFIYLYDHHATALDKFTNWIPPKNIQLVLDVTRCGSRIVYDEFVHRECFYKGTESLVDYVQDCDLWQWELPDSEEINAYINLAERNIETFDRLLIGGCDYWFDKGRVVVQQQNRIVNSHVERIEKFTYNFEGRDYQYGIVNGTYYQSFIGAKILEEHPDLDFSVIYMFIGTEVKYSLRSRKDSDVNVAKIAEVYGGGGHPSAAGLNTKCLLFERPTQFDV